ncbi:hydantoinase B/oxoprolinase family protein [Roseomonas sp. 18066]|uniref:hydantoinase B/oxoprolinase family protein n=1 Tax=Roseomonas sp. 18066 TaxID=2681412 RepID=UPI0013598FBB|nr:hydantoinase B/oxoprolinase family protein [Roseomonas sp. 18066]
MKTDRLSLQILADYAAAAAEAMAYTLMRTAHSTFVKETEDFSCGLLTPDGVTFASPKTLGATWYIGLDYGPAIRLIEDYREGDVCITNDPYSGSVATHTPDIHIWKPVFVEGQLVCFVAGHIHNTDMGGAVPATLSRTLTEIQQEGLRIPPCKLLREGVFNEELLRLMAVNVRLPEQNWGDLNAQIASLAVGERKVKEIVARFGLQAFRDGIADLLDYAEAQARRIVAAIPDGDYEHSEFADEDSEGGPPCRIHITLRVRGDELVLDYTGSDPQLVSSLNMPTGGRERHVLVMVGLGYVLYSLDRSLTLNAGLLRVATAVLPVGTVVNPLPPAAVGMRSLTCSVTQVATLGVFAKALPERMPASPAAGMTIMNVRTMDRRGRPIMASIGPVGGGAGGEPAHDGMDGCGANSSFLKNTPVEINEAEVNVLFNGYGLARDSGGPGLRRGGAAVFMEFSVSAPQTMITARNRDRTRFGCWGLRGGGAGANSRFTRNPDGVAPEELGNRDVVLCQPGDVIRVTGPGAGGWGDAFARDPALVARDVAAGLVSEAQAEMGYGVVLRDGIVDAQATAGLRAVPRTAAALFDYGPGRAAFEVVWSAERYAVLTRLLAGTAVTWRHWVKKAIFTAVEAGEHGGASPGAQLEAIFADLIRRFPQLGGVAE